MEDRSRDGWLWLGTQLVLVGGAFLGISVAVAIAKTPHPDWATTWQAYVAYGLFALSLVCLVGAMRGWRFPLVPRAPRSGP